ncbi:MAG TPA: hypothetical protein VFQ35_09655 [Polyangiaceae bacterium]|nr:hypothetical protein [Polyangiaceae bacterium]
MAILRKQREEALQNERDAARAEAQQARAEAQLGLKVARELTVLVAKLNADLQMLKQATVVDPLLTLFPDLDAEDDVAASGNVMPTGLFAAIVSDDE